MKQGEQRCMLHIKANFSNSSFLVIFSTAAQFLIEEFYVGCIHFKMIHI
jgi:hypothetical protein